MLRTIIISVMLSFIAPISGMAQSASGDPTVDFSDADQRMNAAIEDARSTLPKFLANVVNKEGYSLPRTALKVSFPITLGTAGETGNEIIWVSPFLLLENDTFVGLLANQPSWMEDLNLGDEVSFNMEQIEDWSYTSSDGKLYGNFTTRVMLPQLSQEQRSGLEDVLSKEAVPLTW